MAYFYSAQQLLEDSTCNPAKEKKGKPNPEWWAQNTAPDP